jgi:hypothetical protein
MQNRRATSRSQLPSFLIPCPHCGGRMAMKMIKPVFFADDLEEITHVCDGCGSELSRTARLPAKPHGQAPI